MSGQIQPGPVLQPGEPRYESLGAEFASEDFAVYMRGMAPKGFRFKFIHPLANFLPMIAEKQRPAFRLSLEQQGQNHAIIFHNGLLLDGRNRARELIELKKPISTAVFIGTVDQAVEFVKAENIERRHLNESQRSDFAARVSMMRVGANQYTQQPAQICAPSLPLDDAGNNEEGPAAQPMISQTDAAEMFNVSRRSVQHAATVIDQGAPELQAAVQEGKVAVSTAAEIAKALPKEEQAQVALMSEKEILAKAKTIRKEQNDKRRGERMEKLASQSAGNRELSTLQKFPVIYMDPPTKFAAGDSDRSTENHYPTMTEEEIAALPISDLALDDAVLFIWTTVPWLRKTIRLLEGWGFEYVSEFVWDKETLGLGFWNRNQHETLLVATRGKMPAPDPTVLERSLYREEKTRHSAKPAKFRDIIDGYYPDLPKVELFPRGELPGNWKGWGNEARLTQQQSLGIEGGEEVAA